MAMSRDQRLAATKYKGKQSASEKAATRSAPATPDATDAEVYDRVRDTPASQQRRASAKSSEGISRWRRSVPDRWNG
jgi:hypothetical protein